MGTDCFLIIVFDTVSLILKVSCALSTTEEIPRNDTVLVLMRQLSFGDICSSWSIPSSSLGPTRSKGLLWVEGEEPFGPTDNLKMLSLECRRFGLFALEKEPGQNYGATNKNVLGNSRE